MGEAIGGLPGSPPLSEGGSAEDHAETEVPSIGAYLARQRRLRGMDLDELVAITRIPRRSLERLESGAFDGHSDGFVRGFVRTVAIAIGLDPDETVTRMLSEPALADAGAWLTPAQAMGGIALLLGLAALGAVLVDQTSGGAEEAPEIVAVPAPLPPALPGLVGDRILRRDPVRDLARERGLLPEPDELRGRSPVSPPSDALPPGDAPTPPDDTAT